jgi:hypothetical protein
MNIARRRKAIEDVKAHSPEIVPAKSSFEPFQLGEREVENG